MQTSIASVTIQGITPYSQSRQHDEPHLEGESHDDYERRTWRSKMTTSMIDGRATVAIPAHGLHQALEAAAKYSKRQIPGQGRATWTAKFSAGIAMMDNPILNIDPQAVKAEAIYCNPQGIRGGRGRVLRYFPVIERGWETSFEVYILDPIITQAVFHDILEVASMFIGIGRFRPEHGGHNGRFRITHLGWQDNRQFLMAA